MTEWGFSFALPCWQNGGMQTDYSYLIYWFLWLTASLALPVFGIVSISRRIEQPAVYTGAQRGLRSYRVALILFLVPVVPINLILIALMSGSLGAGWASAAELGLIVLAVSPIFLLISIIVAISGAVSRSAANREVVKLPAQGTVL